MNLVFIGFMGVGKTCVGKGVAERLAWPFIDTDLLIEEALAMSVPQIFAQHGETVFRQVEREVVGRVAQRTRCVIATGGGVVLDPENIDALKENGLLIHLSLSPQTIFDRIGHQSDRPLLETDRPRQTLESLFQERDRLYRACSDLTIDRNGLGVDETIERVLTMADPGRARTRHRTGPNQGA
jgi:shikimate kinase